MEKEQVKIDIEAFKTTNGGSYSDYYIGITNNVKRRIVENISNYLVEHLNAGRYTANAIKEHWECETRNNALEVEEHFHTLGMRGEGPGGHGVGTSRYVYCFKMDDANIQTYLRENDLNTEVNKMKHLMDINTFYKK